MLTIAQSNHTQLFEQHQTSARVEGLGDVHTFCSMRGMSATKVSRMRGQPRKSDGCVAAAVAAAVTGAAAGAAAAAAAAAAAVAVAVAGSVAVAVAVAVAAVAFHAHSVFAHPPRNFLSVCQVPDIAQLVNGRMSSETFTLWTNVSIHASESDSLECVCALHGRARGRARANVTPRAGPSAQAQASTQA